MIERSFNDQEKLKPRIELATMDDWEECKRLRILEISGEDSEMFGFVTPEEIEKEVEKEKSKTKEDWERRIIDQHQFCALSWVGKNAVGFGNVLDKENGLWRIRWGYVEKEFRNQELHKKNIVVRLREIIKRGGTIAESGVVAKNQNSFRNLQLLGFKISETHMEGESDKIYSYTMVVDLTDPDVIKKINEYNQP